MKEQWFEASAPGRLDVMGGIADYSGSLVLQMPIKESTRVRLKLRTDNQCSIVSTVDGERLHASVDYQTLKKKGAVDYTHAQRFFSTHKDISWTAYVLGCVLVLEHEKQIDFTGADFEIESSVPLGKGVSSSASIEVAVMKALAKAFEINFAGTELPRLAQQAENHVVGAPCGLMDQLASYFGVEHRLIPIICQPDKLLPLITIPSELNFIGIDSGVRHSVGGSSYTDVRCAAFMGYSIIAKYLGVSNAELINARLKSIRSSLPFSGYLSNISVDEFESKFEKLLPEKISGAEFLSMYESTIDSVTTIDPNVLYSVKACASHPVYENDRVNEFKSILKGADVNPHLLGQLMRKSHESYSACGLGSSRTDEIVEEFEKFPSVTGAKITGGGSGGTVCALALGNEGINDVLRVHSHFSKKYRTALQIFK
jgi:galactokinase